MPIGGPPLGITTTATGNVSAHLVEWISGYRDLSVLQATTAAGPSPDITAACSR